MYFQYFSFTFKQEELFQIKFKVELKPNFCEERTKSLFPSGFTRWTTLSESCRAAWAPRQVTWVPFPNLEIFTYVNSDEVD